MVYVLPPSILFRRGGFTLGENLRFTDHYGKDHVIEIGPSQRSEDGEHNIYLNVDHHERRYFFQEEAQHSGGAAKAVQLSKKEIEDLAKLGDIRAPFGGNVCEIPVEEGQEVNPGDRVLILEAMKMQTPLASEIGGAVLEIHVELGQTVQPGDKLMKIASDED